MDYIIIQAGGKGSRLEYLTKNKPKALTPVYNLPMIFHLFRKYPDKRFVVIADYKKDVLRKYLASFADVKYQIVDASGNGTCGGIKQATELIPSGEPFMLIWSDLILPESFKLPNEYENTPASAPCVLNCLKCNSKEEKSNGKLSSSVTENYVGISSSFSCRWKYENGVFMEENSIEHGVAGFFLFTDKSVLSDVSESGEFVRWIKDRNIHFKEWSLAGTQEFGVLAEYEKLATVKTRPFNRITIDDNVLIKQPMDEQGKTLAKCEAAWYGRVMDKNISGIPRIYSLSPITMEYIKGKNIYEYNLSYEQKLQVLRKLVDTIKELHEIGTVQNDSFSLKEAYYNKTFSRLSKIENLVPFARNQYVRVNGRNCRNVFFYRDKLEKALERLKCDSFRFIHGDCTFSNMMIREDGSSVVIDPRGYFGYTELYGDVRYDWAKLYYSIVGNYDSFNLKDFTLDIGGHSVVNDSVIKGLDDGEIRLNIKSNGWEILEKDFFELTDADPYEIKLLHAVIWLSLTTYAWQDYDSICGAFYNGLYYLEEVL